MALHERIVRDPAICGGEPVIRGTRVLVRVILGYLESGASVASILEDFPTITDEDVRAVIAFEDARRGLRITSIHVHYGQATVESGGEDGPPELGPFFRGQPQGLCGAMFPGTLYLITGLHTGHVGFEVHVHDREPPIDDGYEDIVELSFRPASDDVLLVEWAAERTYPLPLRSINYRVRYSARRMDEANDQTVLEGEPIIDSYMLEFWPAAPSPQRIVKQTSRLAAYWHDYARTLGNTG